MTYTDERLRELASELLYAVEAMPSDGNIATIATALANAERKGMERAAEIAKEQADARRSQSKDEFQFNKFERRDFDSMSIAGHQISSAILSEAERAG